MIRLIFYFALVAGIATGLAWIADRPGSISVEWFGYEVRTSVFIGLLLLVIFFAALAVAIWIGILTWTAPRRVSRGFAVRKRRIGQEAVRRGIFAAGAGDRLAAMKAGAIAKKNVPDEPLALLLEAQAAQLNEDAIASRQAFERMLEKPEMAELGLRGLFIEAKKAGQLDAAKQFAERALAANPALAWSSIALFEMQCRDQDWRAALGTLAAARQNRHLSRTEADKRRAVLLTALAAEIEDTQQNKALAYALEAYELMPSLTPAAVIASRVLASQGNVGRATKIAGQAWRVSPHPDLALIYAHARTGDSPRDRLTRVKALAASCSASLEGDIAVAVAAVEAKEWSTARTALEPHLANNPPGRVCRLMARIEAGQNRDAGRAREWLAKVARAAPDPAWVAPDGTVSVEWQPISRVSGLLGAFEWKAPQTAALNDSNDIVAEITALDIPVVEAQASWNPENSGGDTGHYNESRDVIVAGSSARIMPLDKSSELKPAAGPAVVDAEIVNMAPASTSGAPESGIKAILPAVQDVPEAAATEKPRPQVRTPAIFVPGPAPDDPGTVDWNGDDGTTPLSRFRSPS